MTFALLDAVRLREPCDGWCYGEDGVVHFEAGAKGTIVELFPPGGAELEFVAETGRVIGAVAVPFDKLEPV